MTDENKRAIAAHPQLTSLVAAVESACGPALRAAVVYGSLARGDFDPQASDVNLLLVLDDDGPSILDRLTPALSAWLRAGQPMPVLFTPKTLAAAVDVFPIEISDLLRARIVLRGPDPLAGIVVGREHLRLACERGLREKRLRLIEGFVVAGGRESELERLIAQSYSTFLALFRGCLALVGGEAPLHDDAVFVAFAERAGIDPEPFRAAAELRRGERPAGGARALFSRYHAAVDRAADAVDCFRGVAEESNR